MINTRFLSSVDPPIVIVRVVPETDVVGVSVITTESVVECVCPKMPKKAFAP